MKEKTETQFYGTQKPFHEKPNNWTKKNEEELSLPNKYILDLKSKGNAVIATM